MKLFSLLLYLVPIIAIANAQPQLTCYVCNDCENPFDNNEGLLEVCDSNNVDAFRPGFSGDLPIIIPDLIGIHPTFPTIEEVTTSVPTIADTANVTQSAPILINPAPTFAPPVVSIEPVPTSPPPIINIVDDEESKLEAHETPKTHKYDGINRDQILKMYNFPLDAEYYCFRVTGINAQGQTHVRRGCVQHFGEQQQTCALSLTNTTSHPDDNHCYICNTPQCNDSSATNIKISILTLFTMICIVLRIQN